MGKVIITVVIMGSLLFLVTCRSGDIKTGAITTEHTGSLIPYVEYDSRNKIWGYLDEDTGEIVIKAQYVYAAPFAGNFAVVRKGWHTGESIINRAGKSVSAGRFDRVYFIVSENGKSAAALLETRHTRQKLHLGWVTRTKSGFYTDEYYKYRVVNPATGKTIIPEKEGYLIYHIETAGDYFLVDTDLYRFLDNGGIECAAKDDPALAVGILKDYFEGRGINARIEAGSGGIKIDYRPYIEETYADPDLSGAFEDLDPEFAIPFEGAEPFYRDPRVYLNAPLEISERSYLLRFRNGETGERAMGVYNESKAEWVIWPNFHVLFTDTNTEKTYYVVEIHPTNNPDVYRIYLTNDEIGWHSRALFSGGIFNAGKKEFMDNLYLFEEFPPQAGLVLGLPGEGERDIKFPDYGVYYRDYSRIKN
jgi:hypothetical protein